MREEILNLSEIYEEDYDVLFTLNRDGFQNSLSVNNIFELQHHFRSHSQLSQSLLVWRESRSDPVWGLIDFGNQRVYSLYETNELSEQGTGTKEQPVMHVSEVSYPEERLRNPQVIHDLLQMSPGSSSGLQGTDIGFIDLLMKIDLVQVDLEELKRANLSGSGFDFESVHPNLLEVHDMFREILGLEREHIIKLLGNTWQTVWSILPQFFEIAEKIRDFTVSDENPIKTHSDLLKEISDYCHEAKSSLSPTITYLRSEEVKQYESQLKSTLDTAVEKFENETDRAKKINNDNEEKQQTLNELILKQENQLLETSMKPYAKMFAEQANTHQKSARFWFKVVIGLNIVFAILFGWLISALAPAGSELPLILQNLLTKGFFLSLVYLLLNRVIKNYTAEKHLEIVNLHRKNALDTFQEFADAAGENRETRDQVLLAATHAIFDTNQSGYLSVKTSRSESASPIQNMFRAVIPGKNE